MFPSFPALSCEFPVSVKENTDRKKHELFQKGPISKKGLFQINQPQLKKSMGDRKISRKISALSLKEWMTVLSL